ncbi:MAG: PaaX family transcriptional regulator C-terminal domain-containing protein, partial [Mycobacteriales bacterium]
PDDSCPRFDVRPATDPVQLAVRLWDLDGWAGEARALLAAMAAEAEPARVFTVSAAVVRLLRRDPLLPAELLPADWPGAQLRETYADYEATLVALLTGSPEASARHRAR